MGKLRCKQTKLLTTRKLHSSISQALHIYVCFCKPGGNVPDAPRYLEMYAGLEKMQWTDSLDPPISFKTECKNSPRYA